MALCFGYMSVHGFRFRLVGCVWGCMGLWDVHGGEVGNLVASRMATVVQVMRGGYEGQNEGM